MDATTLASRGPGLVEAEVAGELVGLDVEHGHCYGFNATATRVWRLLEKPQTLGALCDQLMLEHDVDRGTCLSDVGSLLETLAADGLVRLVPVQ